jgi:methylphosphotriester-DNA--protein-cysteine methyltransferase
MQSSTPPNTLFKTDSSRWAAVQTRNPLAASSFVYCVTTTQICCRPTCKARLARRSNVLFHDSYAAASAAGFRACKRCKPELLAEYDPQADVVSRACKLIEDVETEMGEAKGKGGVDGRRLKLGDLAREAGLTKSHFHRVFKKVTGVTPRVWAVNVRAERMLGGGREMEAVNTPELVASEGLSREGSDGVLTPGVACGERGQGDDEGFVAPQLQALGFDAVFEPGVDYLHSGFVTTTKEDCTFTKKIEYTIQPWASGFVLIAATRDGVCWLEAGNSVGELSWSLAHEFPQADLEMSEWSTNTGLGELQNGNHGMFATVMEALIRPTGRVLNVPLDIS